MMVVFYAFALKLGGSQFEAFMAAGLVPLIAFVLVMITLTELGGRDRMDAPIALWTTFYMAFALTGSLVFPFSPWLALVLTAGFAVTAVSVAILLERLIIGGKRGQWYFEYGLLPFAILCAASAEQGGDQRGAAVGLLIFAGLLNACWQKGWEWFDRGLKPET